MADSEVAAPAEVVAEEKPAAEQTSEETAAKPEEAAEEKKEEVADKEEEKKEEEETKEEGGEDEAPATEEAEAQPQAAEQPQVEVTPPEPEPEVVATEAEVTETEAPAPVEEVTSQEPAPEVAVPEPVEAPAAEEEEKPMSRLEREMSMLPEDERETFTALFEMYSSEDDAGFKTISKAGIKLLFRFMGEIVTDQIVTQWLQEDDKNVDGKLSLEEFCIMYKKRREPEDKRKEELLVCLNTLFPCNGGDDSISLGKVKGVLKLLQGQPGLVSEASVLTEEDISAAVAKIDTDGSKTVSRQEFVNFLVGKN